MNQNSAHPGKTTACESTTHSSPPTSPEITAFLPDLIDFGPEPFVVNIKIATKLNHNYRSTLWTSPQLQLTLMNINPGESNGLKIQPHDQFIHIQEGDGFIMMGDSEDSIDFRAFVSESYILIIPAGKWHNLINVGQTPIKLFSIYSPQQYPRGTVHETHEIAAMEEQRNLNQELPSE